MADNHPDPITEGFAQSGQRLVQVIALVTIWRQARVRRTQRLQHARAAKAAAEEHRVANEIKAAFEEARSRWAPAHDREWLRQADLLQVARAWAAALAYADDSPAAAAAAGKCEQRLRELHPHAMEHYDRLRSNGLPPEQAMGEAASFFSRDPRMRTGYASPERRQLGEGTDTQWVAAEHGPTRKEWEEHRQEQRGRRLLDELIQQDPQMRPGDLRTALINDTNLPEHLITKITSPGDDPLARSQELRGASAERDRAAGLGHATDDHATLTVDERTTGLTEANRATGAADAAKARSGQRSPAQVAAEDFPLSIGEAMRMTAQRPPEHASPRKSRNPSPQRSPRDGR